MRLLSCTLIVTARQAEQARQTALPEWARRCAHVQQTLDKLADFAFVVDTHIIARETEHYLSYSSDDLPAVIDCADSCRKRNWRKAFESTLIGCAMYAEIDTIRTDYCQYWFRRR